MLHSREQISRDLFDRVVNFVTDQFPKRNMPGRCGGEPIQSAEAGSSTNANGSSNRFALVTFWIAAKPSWETVFRSGKHANLSDADLLVQRTLNSLGHAAAIPQ